jgi:hypothetical protein
VRDVVGLGDVVRVAAANDVEGRERGEASRDVHDEAAGEVLDAPLSEEALAGPDPVARGAVNENEPARERES